MLQGSRKFILDMSNVYGDVILSLYLSLCAGLFLSPLSLGGLGELGGKKGGGGGEGERMRDRRRE